MPTIGSRLAAWLGLFASAACWIALVPYALVFFASNYAVNTMIARPDLVAPERIGLMVFVIGQMQYLAWALVALFLARRLGGDAPRTAWGSWIMLVIAYLLLGQYLPSVVSALAMYFAEVSEWASSVASIIGLLFGFALFPLVLRLIAVAHSANDLRLGAIWEYLVGEGLGLYILFILFDLVLFTVTLGVDRAAGTDAAAFVTLQAFSALRGIAVILFYVMAYREVRAAVSDLSRTAA